MNSHQMDIRKRVLAQIVRVMEDAMAKGYDPHSAAQAAFPGTPDEVLWDAFYEAEDPRIEAWWSEAERKIDDTMAQKSNDVVDFVPMPAGPRETELDAAFAALVAGAECTP